MTSLLPPHRILFLLVAWGLALFPLSARGEDPSARLDAALAEAKAQLAREKAAWEDGRKRFEARKAEIGADRAELSGAGEKLEADQAAVEKSLKEGRDRLAELEDRSRDLGTRLEAIQEFLVNGVEVLRTRVALAMDHGGRAEKRKEIEALRSDLAGADPDLPHLTRRYFQQVHAEAVLGSTAEVFPTKVALDSGEEKGARVLRLGRAFAGYVTDDGRQAGLLYRDATEEGGYTWRETEGQKFARALAGAMDGAGREGDAHNLPLDVTMELSPAYLRGQKDLLSVLVSGGPLVIPLLLVALAAALLIGERTLFLLRNRPRTTALRAGFLAPLAAGDGEGAAAYLAKARGPLARVLRAGYGVRATGKTAVEESITEAAVVEMARLERFLSAIAAMAVVAPLLGLLGTVTGMISTFDVITIFGTGDPRLLSGGISEALVTTQIGLIIAVPVLLAHNVLSSRVNVIVSAMETVGAAYASLVERQAAVEGSLEDGPVGGDHA